jgi:hypothetical protein
VAIDPCLKIADIAGQLGIDPEMPINEPSH